MHSFSTVIFVKGADEAESLAHEACQAYFGKDVPYSLTLSTIAERNSWGHVTSYQVQVEAVRPVLDLDVQPALVLARRAIMRSLGLRSAWGFDRDVDGEALHHQLRAALGISQEEYEEQRAPSTGPGALASGKHAGAADRAGAPV